MKRRIAVFTGNRAEYSLLFPVLKALENHPTLEMRLIVACSHLSPEYGATIAEIQADKVSIAKQIDILSTPAEKDSVAKTHGKLVLALTEALCELKADLALIYGDRTESFAATCAAACLGLPIGHIEGGDITEGGSLDDTMRHAMTKLSHLHFCTNEDAVKVVVQLGEEPWRVHNVGLPSIDLVRLGRFAPPEAFSFLDKSRPIIAFTQHPLSHSADCAKEQISICLQAISTLLKKGYQVVATYPNNDSGGHHIIDALKNFPNHPRFFLFKSLGRFRYHGLLHLIGQHSGVCLGNTSSGLKETPSFCCMSVQIGPRQSGRLAADNVRFVDYDTNAIVNAVENAIAHPNKSYQNPYGNGKSAEHIAAVLSQVSFDEKLVKKRFIKFQKAHV